MDGWKIMEWALPIVSAVVVWALGMLARWLASKTANERLRALLMQVRDAATDAVSAVQQTMVDAMKAADSQANGLTDAQKSAALAAALVSLKASLGTKGLDALKAAIGFGQAELETYLTGQIEAAVGDAKRSAP